MDIYAFVRIPVRFFQTIGLVPFQLAPPNQPVPPIPLWKTLHLFVSVFLVFIGIQGELVNFYIYVRQPEYFVYAASVCMYIGFNLLSYSKMLTIHVQRPLLNRVVAELDAMFPRSLAARIEFRIEHYLRISLRLIRSYALFMMMMIWFFNLFPAVEAILNLLRTGQWRIDFPYEVWYPYEKYDRGWFELTYLMQWWGSYSAATGAMCVDILICSLVGQICMHFDRLSTRLRKLRPTPGGRAEAQDFAVLVDCVRMHERLIGISKDLDDIFKMCILFNIMSSVCVICMNGFLLTTATEKIHLVKFAMALFTTVVQVLLICVVGDMFTVSSSGVADAAWESEWFNGSRRFKSAILMMIVRAQRPQNLTAYKYANVSIIMFSNVVSTSWKLFVMISSVYDD